MVFAFFRNTGAAKGLGFLLAWSLLALGSVQAQLSVQLPDTLTRACADTLNLQPQVSGNVGPVNYQWTPQFQLDLSDPSQPRTWADIQVTYTLILTDSTGQTTTTQITILPDTCPTAQAGPDTALACGDTLRLNGQVLNADSLTTAEWQNPVNLADSSQLDSRAWPVANTSYILKVQRGAWISRDTVRITVNGPCPTPPLQVDAGPDTTLACGDSLRLNALLQPAAGGVSWFWSPQAGLDSFQTPDPWARPLQTTTYTVSAYDTTTGQLATDSVTITVQNCLDVAIIPDTIVRCVDTLQLFVNVKNSIGPDTVYWRVDSTFLDTSASPRVYTTTDRTYHVTVEDSLSTYRDSVRVTVIGCGRFLMDLGADRNIVCGNTITLNPSFNPNAPSNALYTWSPSQGLSSDSTASTQASPDTTTRYSLTVTDTSSGFSATDSVLVTVTPCYSVIAPNDTTIDPGDTLDLLARLSPPAPGVEFRWSPVYKLGSDTGQLVRAWPDTTTTYVVIGTYLGYSDTDTVTVTVNPLLEACILGNPSQFGFQSGIYPDTAPDGFVAQQYDHTAQVILPDSLFGGLAVQATLDTVRNLPGGLSASWNPSGPWTSLPLHGCLRIRGRPFQATGPNDTLYLEFKVQLDSLGGTPVTYVAPYKLTIQSSLPPLSVQVTPDTIIQLGDTVRLQATANQQGVQYAWSPPIFLSNPGKANPDAWPDTTTSYTVTATKGNQNATARVTVFIQPQASGCTAVHPDSLGPPDWYPNPAPVGSLNQVYTANAQLVLPDTVFFGQTPLPVVEFRVTNVTDLPTGLTWVTGAPGNRFTRPDSNSYVTGCFQFTGIPTDTTLSTDSAGILGTLVTPTQQIPYRFNYHIPIVNALPPLSVDVGPDKQLDCGASVGLNATANRSTGVTYSWSPTRGLDDPSRANPIASPLNTTTYVLTAWDFRDTVYDTLTVEVGLCPLSVDLGPNRNLNCGDSLQLQPVVNRSPGEVSYAWAPHPSLSNDTLANPWAAPDSTLTYTLTVTDTFGQSVSDQITLTPGSYLPPPLVTGASRCGPGSVNLNARGASTLLWFANPLDTAWVHSGQIFQTPTLSATDTYYVQAVEPGCDSSLRVPVTAQVYNNGFVQVNADTTSLVLGESLLLENATTPLQNYQYTWWVNSQVVSSSAVDSLRYTFQQVGAYQVRLEAQSKYGCQNGVSTLNINVLPDPNSNARFTGSPTVGQAPLQVNFASNNLSAGGYFWDFGDGATSTLANPTHTYTLPGVYTVELNILVNGFWETETRQLYISALPGPNALTVDWSASPVAGQAPLAVQFNNLSQNANSFQWTFTDDQGQVVGASTGLNPLFVFNNPGVYSVELVGSNAANLKRAYKPNWITVQGGALPPELCLDMPAVAADQQEFEVQVRVNNLNQPVRQLDVRLQYDPTHLEYLLAQKGPWAQNATSPGAQHNPLQGTVDLQVKAAGPSLSGTGVLYTIRFRVNPGPGNDTTARLALQLAEGVSDSLTPFSIPTCSPTLLPLTSGEVVWPGDTDKDKLCGPRDGVFLISQLFPQQSGPARTDQSSQWRAHLGAAWNQTETVAGDTVDLMHADASGNGAIFLEDILPVLEHQGNTHQKAARTTNDTLPCVNVSVPAEMPQGKVARVLLTLGDTANPVQDLQGLVARLRLDPDLVDLTGIQASYVNSWLGDFANTFYAFTEAKPLNGEFFVYAGRTGISPVSGTGQLCELLLPVKASAPVRSQLVVEVREVWAYNGEFFPLEIVGAADTGRVVTAYDFLSTSRGESAPQQRLALYPNPTAELATLELAAPLEKAAQVRVLNLLGEVLLQQPLAGGQQQASLNLNALPAGLYVVQVETTHGLLQRKLIKQ